MRHFSPTLVQASLMIVSLFGASLGWAGTFTAFGPQSCLRDTGKPVPVSNTFSILNSNTQYRPHVQNSGVSSAVMSVNGIKILGPGNFEPNVASIDRPVALNLSNEIDVQLRTKPDSGLTVSVIGADNDLPVITATVNPPAHSFCWKNNVVVTFTCSDKTSGVASCPAPVTVSIERANHVISEAATDQAGNIGSTLVAINLDKTPPTIAASPAPPDNTFGWNSTSVTVTLNCADSLSGVATCTAPITLSPKYANQTVRGTTTDKAGNIGSAAAAKTPPTISVQPTPAPNVAGWNNTNVTVSFSCADALSRIANCPGPQTISSSGANQSLSGIAADKGGNIATAANLNIDKTPPVVNINIAPQLNASGWNITAVSIACNGSAAVLQGNSFSCSVNLSPGANTITVIGTDVAGNGNSQALTVNLGPTITDFNPKSASVGGLITVSRSSFAATTLAFVILDGAASGVVTIALGAQTMTSTAILTIVPLSDFSLAVGPNTANLIQGQTVNFAVTRRCTRVPEREPRLHLARGGDPTDERRKYV